MIKKNSFRVCWLSGTKRMAATKQVTITKLCQGLGVIVQSFAHGYKLSRTSGILTASVRRASIPHASFMWTLKNNQETQHK